LTGIDVPSMFYCYEGKGILLTRNENPKSKVKYLILSSINSGDYFNEENVIYDQLQSKFFFLTYSENAVFYQLFKPEFENNETFDKASRNTVVGEYLSK